MNKMKVTFIATGLTVASLMALPVSAKAISLFKHHSGQPLLSVTVSTPGNKTAFLQEIAIEAGYVKNGVCQIAKTHDQKSGGGDDISIDPGLQTLTSKGMSEVFKEIFGQVGYTCFAEHVNYQGRWSSIGPVHLVWNASLNQYTKADPAYLNWNIQ